MTAVAENPPHGHNDTPARRPKKRCQGMEPADIVRLPAFVPLDDVGRALGKSRATIYRLARNSSVITVEGSAGIPVLRVGGQRGCTLAAICEHLRIPLTP